MEQTFLSFDRQEKARVNYFRPDRYRTLYKTLNEQLVISIRGAGLSYCAASFGEETSVISTKEFNRILSFNADKNLITVECGINLGNLLEFLISKEKYIPILPGHPTITVGGCIAFNVHGKSQFQFGNFKNGVENFLLYHPSRGEIFCSRDENKELFDLTIGGMGFTGYLAQATLRLNDLRGKNLKIKREPVENLNHSVEMMLGLKDKCDFLYSWNNLNLKQESFGKGFLHIESFTDDAASSDTEDYTPLEAQDVNEKEMSLLTAFTSKAMCVTYALLEKAKKSETVLGLKKASFPIHGKEIYFKLFGARGFREYQLIVSFDAWKAFLNDLQKLISKTNVGISLGSLKLFAGKTQYLNFEMDGVCLAIDVPADKLSLDFFAGLDALMIDYKGLVNLSKDSRLNVSVVKKLFSEYELFKERINDFDPTRRFQSLLRKRLEI